jgi:hypothetical protein
LIDEAGGTLVTIDPERFKLLNIAVSTTEVMMYQVMRRKDNHK